MVSRRARKIQAFDDFIGFGLQLSYGIWNLFQNHEVRNYLISQMWADLACIPTFHTTAPCSGISTFTIRGLYILFPTFHLRRTRSTINVHSTTTFYNRCTLNNNILQSVLFSAITYPKYNKYSSKVSATRNTYEKQ